MTDQSASSRGPSTARLLASALDQVRGLLRREIDLARAEGDRALRHVGAAVGLLAGALVLGLGAIDVLAAAVVAFLVESGTTPAWAASLIVGGCLALVALALAAAARSAMRRVRLAPERVAGNLREDVRTARKAGHDQD